MINDLGCMVKNSYNRLLLVKSLMKLINANVRRNETLKNIRKVEAGNPLASKILTTAELSANEQADYDALALSIDFADPGSIIANIGYDNLAYDNTETADTIMLTTLLHLAIRRHDLTDNQLVSAGERGVIEGLVSHIKPVGGAYRTTLLNEASIKEMDNRADQIMRDGINKTDTNANMLKYYNHEWASGYTAARNQLRVYVKNS